MMDDVVRMRQALTYRGEIEKSGEDGNVELIRVDGNRPVELQTNVSMFRSVR